MDARLVFPLLLVAAAAPLASAQLASGFYKTSCPDAEKIIFGVVEKRFKEDPGTAASLLRLVFHDCFANGCDASILIDPLSNQAAEKEAGPNISVKGYDIIDDIKTELEKQCPNVVSCADILAVSARDAVRLTGGPAYEVTTGRRDSLVSNREDADNLPGPDIAVPKLIDDFSKKGFSTEEMVALLAGGHTIGNCKCFFIEADAAPIDPEYKKNISAACDGANRDKGAVPMDQITPNVFDGNYFGLVLAKKMPLTIDRLMGLDPRTEPIIKAMAAKPEDFIPKFAKSMEKISVLQVLTGKDGEIRRSCSEFNNPQPTNDGPSVIRISSLQPDQMQGVSQPGAKGVAEARKVGGRADIRKINGGEGGNKATAGEGLRKEASGEAASQVAGREEIKQVASNEAVNKEPGGAEIGKATGNEAATNVMGGMDVNKVTENQATNVVGSEAGSKVAGGVENSKVVDNQAASKVSSGEEVKKVAGNEAANKVTSNVDISKVAGNEESTKVIGGEEASKGPGSEEIKKAVGSQPPGQVISNAEINKAVGTEAISNKATGGIEANANSVLGDEPASKLPGGVATVNALGEKNIEKRHSPKLRGRHEAANGAPGSEDAANAAGDEEIRKRNSAKLRGGQEAANVAPGAEEAAKAAADEEIRKRNSAKLRGGQEAANVAPGVEEPAKAAADEEIKKRSSLRGGQQ
ncbi:uncharacterized protein LOC133914506 [Phragmites australis]|uniref:uncharacterized protein LOC133914506 n=1 Tax=Phragmites australis TaxID=29695 RepID=UPI002D790423|nr:uncharacterized protein LOC133914506 [Phragmites australis]